jgi:cysteine-rich repeat protein
VPECFANCSVVDYCTSCTVSTSASGDFIGCLACSNGYSVDAGSNTCMPICGDGNLAPLEACEDNNNVDGDGCSSVCGV